MRAKQVAQYGLLASMMLVLGFVERQFMLVPGVPGIRLGLSNTVLLYALCLMSARGAWLLMGLKVGLSAFLYAGVSGLFYSFAGGVLSLAAMLLALLLPGLGIVGVSVLGATAHMVGQILMSRLMLGTWAAAVQAPLLFVAAVATGVLTGVIAVSVCRGVAHGDPEMQKRLAHLGLTGRNAK